MAQGTRAHQAAGDAAPAQATSAGKVRVLYTALYEADNLAFLRGRSQAAFVVTASALPSAA